jgi:hypothetical protein
MIKDDYVVVATEENGIWAGHIVELDLDMVSLRDAVRLISPDSDGVFFLTNLAVDPIRVDIQSSLTVPCVYLTDVEQIIKATDEAMDYLTA